MAVRGCTRATAATDLDPPAAAIAAGTLTVLLAQYEPPPFPVHLVLPSARSRTAKQRAFLSFAAPLLRRALVHAAEQIGDSRPDAL